MSYSKKYMNSECELVNFRGIVLKKIYKPLDVLEIILNFEALKKIILIRDMRLMSFSIHGRHAFVNGVQFLDMFDVSNTKCGRAYSKKSDINKQKY